MTVKSKDLQHQFSDLGRLGKAQILQWFYAILKNSPVDARIVLKIPCIILEFDTDRTTSFRYFELIMHKGQGSKGIR